jgi:GTPase SAR1 family protein
MTVYCSLFLSLLQMGKTSLVRALLSPSFKCDPILLRDRTVGIDRSEMELRGPVPDSPTIDVQIWDLAGQDVYTLSHSVHFSYRCIYMLLWKPGEALDATMRRLSPWLESLCAHVPDARIVLVASHCKTSITWDEFLSLSPLVEDAVKEKVRELNEISELEVDKLRSMFNDATAKRQRLEADYVNHLRTKEEFVQKDAMLLQRVAGSLDAWAARASAKSRELPRSLRMLAADVHDTLARERLLCKRLQLLLGIRNGGYPDARDACKLTLHCHSVDSVDGYGVVGLRQWLYQYCLSLPFVGEMIPSIWTALINIFHHFGDSVLSRSDALAIVRQHLARIPRSLNLSDDAIWRIIEFWSDVGRIFVYESQVVRNPSTLIALLKVFLHHRPLEIMNNPSYQSLVVDDSRKKEDTNEVLERSLKQLTDRDELPLQLLDHLSAWKHLKPDQRSSMLVFFERSHLLCQKEQQPDVRFVSARMRAKDYLTSQVEDVTSKAKYHVLYLLPLNHIGIMAHLLSIVTSYNLENMYMNIEWGRDSLYLHRSFSSVDHPCTCVFSAEDYLTCVERRNSRFASLRGQHGQRFSCVLRIACTDFGLLKFATTCADAAFDSCSFGSRFRCYLTVAGEQEWIMFRDSASSFLNRHSLSHALQQNVHHDIKNGRNIIDFLGPQSSIFVSHAWGDGTGQFIKRLKLHLEQQTLANVWVDVNEMNQTQDSIISSFRAGLCQARVVFIALTPTYLTRPNCLRELRWALDFHDAYEKMQPDKCFKVVPLYLHTAVTYEERMKLVNVDEYNGLVFVEKEKKVKRLSPEAIELVKRLNSKHMGDKRWVDLQACFSDQEMNDWEEHRKGKDANEVNLEGLVEEALKLIRKMLHCVRPREVSECHQMDDSDALNATVLEQGEIHCKFREQLSRGQLYPGKPARQMMQSFQLLKEGDSSWQLDSSRDSCDGENCGNKRFNMINRKHHCRCIFI